MSPTMGDTPSRVVGRRACELTHAPADPRALHRASEAAICNELFPVSAFVILVGAAASELLNAGMCIALSAAALFTEIT